MANHVHISVSKSMYLYCCTKLILENPVPKNKGFLCYPIAQDGLQIFITLKYNVYLEANKKSKICNSVITADYKILYKAL